MDVFKKINDVGGSNFWVDFGDDIAEFFVANHAVSVLISEINGLIDFRC